MTDDRSLPCILQKECQMTVTLETPLRTIADQVCDLLRSELLAGNHFSGSAMREEELAARFGVSRHPVRKALQKLALEGLLNAKPNRGMVVATALTEHVQGLLTPLRCQLELYALTHAAEKLNEDHRHSWQAIIRRMERAGEDQNAQEVLDQDMAFHQQLLIVAGLEDMLPVWQGIYSRMRDYHRVGNSKLADLRFVAFAHRLLLNSLFSGRLSKARADWESHLTNGDFNKRALASWQRQRRLAEKKG